VPNVRGSLSMTFAYLPLDFAITTPIRYFTIVTSTAVEPDS
jgi:hypothetical protein